MVRVLKTDFPVCALNPLVTHCIEFLNLENLISILVDVHHMNAVLFGLQIQTNTRVDSFSQLVACNAININKKACLNQNGHGCCVLVLETGEDIGFLAYFGFKNTALFKSKNMC